jgi:nudix-type nucleoside diphosphatase (YffH/AdpP family)
MNERIRLREQTVLSDNWYTLRKVTFDYQRKNGIWETQSREAYDRGNGATILLHNPTTDTVILTRQFRLPTFVNGNPSGMLIEACAGLLDDEHPDVAIVRETEEETGYRLSAVQKVLEAYMSGGPVAALTKKRLTCWNYHWPRHWQWSPAATFKMARPSFSCSTFVYNSLAARFFILLNSIFYADSNCWSLSQRHQ